MRALLLTVLLGLACRDVKPAPRDIELSPSSGLDDRETPILITGRFISAAFEIDRGKVTGVRDVSVELGGQPLDAVISERNALSAVVPPSMPAGSLALELIDPFEQSIRIDDAFCVLGPAAQVTSLVIEAPPTAIEGEPISIELIALGAEGVVERFDGRAILSGAVVANVGPFTRGVWTGTISASIGSIALKAEVDRSDDRAASCSPATGSGEATIEISPEQEERDTLAFPSARWPVQQQSISTVTGGGDTWVVDDDTCPAVGSGTDADPFCAIGSALGTRPNIQVRAGNYSENLVFATSQTLIADDGAVLTSESLAPTIDVVMNATVRIVGLRVESLMSGSLRVGGNAELDLSEATVGPTNGIGIQARDSSRLIVRRTLVVSSNSNGISLETTGSYEVINDIIADGGGNGILVSATAATAILRHVTVSNNGGWGIDCGVPADLMNSIIWSNGGGDLNACTPRYSDYSVGPPRGTTNIGVDPQFAAGATYHLLGTSPCIDAGSTIGAPFVDFDGELRPQRGGVDMGADEVP